MKKLFPLLIFCLIFSYACTPTTEAIPTTTELIEGTPGDMGTPTAVPTPFPTETEETTITDYLPGISYFDMEFEGKKRFYMVFLPEGYSKVETYPLVIYLHSYGWGAQKGMDYTRFNNIADTFGFMIAFPSARPNWNSGIGDHPKWGTPDNNDVEFLDVMIDQITDAYNIDEKRIFATGYSNGGFMAYKLACQLSHRIAAVASVSGVLSESTLDECNPSHTIPVLQIHGTKDGHVPIDGEEGWHSVEETLDFWVQGNTCTEMDLKVLEDINTSDESTVEKITYTNCKDNSSVIYYKVIGGGHTWPGADPPGYPAGKTNLDFDASLAIWEFFMGYKILE